MGTEHGEARQRVERQIEEVRVNEIRKGRKKNVWLNYRIKIKYNRGTKSMIKKTLGIGMAN